MESFLPSEIGRLIYGYLSECDENLAEMFLNSSGVMEECRYSKQKFRKFNSKVQGLSLTDILDQYSILCSLIFRNVDSTECHHVNVLNLLQHILKSKVREHDNESTISVDRFKSTKSDMSIQTDPDNTHENMDVTSSSVNEVNELPKQPPAINLLDSENEVNSSNTEKPVIASSIDLTPPPASSDSHKPVTTIKKMKTRSDVTNKNKRKVEVPKVVKTVEQKTPKKLENKTQIVDSVFNSLSVNHNSRIVNYMTPLKSDKRYVFGENILHINNCQQKVSENLSYSRIFGSISKNLPMSPLSFGSPAPKTPNKINQNIATSQNTNSISETHVDSKRATEKETTTQCTVPSLSEQPPVCNNEQQTAVNSIITVANSEITSVAQENCSPVLSNQNQTLESPKPKLPMFGIATLNPKEHKSDKKLKQDVKKIPWDMNLRKFVADSIPEKKEKKCKRESRKIMESTSKKRKTDEENPKLKKNMKIPEIKEKETVLEAPIHNGPADLQRLPTTEIETLSECSESFTLTEETFVLYSANINETDEPN